MTLGSELAAIKVGPKWEVGPMEDVVQALMETLVDPLLPLRASNVPPSEDVQKSVAKQMHAVVLLYNYYHRKQKPELLFLDFVYFCKLAMVIRPPLIAFMKLMKESKPMKPNGAEDQLSVTEKAIKDACDISVALDASRDVPNTEGWPISKVAVLLIDSKKKHCMLQFGNVGKGAWSLIEKELNEPSINPEISAEEKVGSKRKRNYQMTSTCETEILQLAYDAMKGVTGIDSSDFEVLESHVTYSLSKEKSATRFFMMQCPGSIMINEQVPLKFLVESLQGPLAEKLAYSFWKTTPVVEFHHLLPYVDFISCWLSGIDLCVPSLSNCNTQSITNGCEELSRSSKSALTVSNNDGNDFGQIDNDSSWMEADTIDKITSENCGTEKDGNVTDKSNKNCDTLDSAEDSRKIVPGNLGNDIKQPDQSSLSGPSRGLSLTVVNVDCAVEKLKKGCDPASRISVEISGNDDQKGFVSCPSRQLSEKMVIDDSATEKFNETHDTEYSEDEDALSGPSRGMSLTMVSVDSAMEELKKGCDPASRISVETSDNDDQKGFVSCPSRHLSEKMAIENNAMEKFNENHDTEHSEDKNALSGSSRGLRSTNTSDLTNIGTESEDASKKLSSEIRVYHHRRKANSSAQKDAQLREDESTLKVKVESDHTQHKDAKVSGDNGDVTNTCNQTCIAKTEGQLAQFEATIKCNIEEQSASASDQLQNALTLLYRKRQELYSRICNMEDTLALCEDDIVRIRDGGEIGLARECINSLINGKYHPLLEHGAQVKDKGNQQSENNDKSQNEYRARLSETYLLGKSSCQDLEYTCLKNNWRLPRYLTKSSDGKFVSYVVVEGKDFKLHAKGSFESKPGEARDSAAAEMIVVMRNASLSGLHLCK